MNNFDYKKYIAEGKLLKEEGYSESVNAEAFFTDRIASHLNRIAQAEFGMDYDQLGSGEKEWVRDEIDNMTFEGEVNEEEYPSSAPRVYVVMLGNKGGPVGPYRVYADKSTAEAEAAQQKENSKQLGSDIRAFVQDLAYIK